MSNSCAFCGGDAFSVVGSVACCNEHSKIAWLAVTTAASPAQVASLNARELVAAVRSSVGDDKGHAALDALVRVLWPEPPSGSEARDVADVALLVRQNCDRIMNNLLEDQGEVLRCIRDIHEATDPNNFAIGR